MESQLPTLVEVCGTILYIFVLSNSLLLRFFLVSKISLYPEICFVIFINILNVFQTPFPRVQDVWLSHFNNQLSDCFMPASEDVLDHHLPVGGVVDPLQGIQEGVDVLAVSEDAARHVLLGTEVPRDVGPAVVDEQVLHVPEEARGNALVHQNSVPVQDGVREGVLCNPVQNQVLVQSPGMSLTELVLLHRDAQMLNMEVVMESSKSSWNLRRHHPPWEFHILQDLGVLGMTLSSCSS